MSFSCGPRSLVVALLGLSAISAAGANAPAAQAGVALENPIATPEQRCPEVAIIAARGSEQNFETTPHAIAHEAISGLVNSLRSGIANAPGFVADFEHRTGCQPDYILFGYSQGSIVLSHLEQHLHEKGQLRGVVYLGNPQLGAGDPSTVGNPRVGNGLLPGAAGLESTVIIS